MAVRFSKVAAGLLAGALISMPVAAQAQSESGGGQAQQQVEITDKKFDAFIGAALAVIEVRKTWTPKIQGAQGESEKQEMVKSAREEMSKAVKDQPGISTEEYIAIARQAREDQELAQRIQARVQEEQGAAGQQ